MTKHEYYESRKDEFKAKAYAQKKRARREVLNHYGAFCRRCGISDERVLVLDHTKGGGNAHRKLQKINSGADTYLWVIRNNFPEDFRILCHNCNFLEWLENKVKAKYSEVI